ncbi:MAG: hypothetical protein EPO68_11000 [Planctomycetota bacterium]|nr:MAG: hypothetical protein EPO68_11000 [Planctomycetota bacterium]
MNTTFLTALTNVHMPTIGGRGDQIGSGLFVTTDPRFIDRLLTPAVCDAIGGLEASHIRSAAALIYSQLIEPDAGFDWKVVLDRQLRLVHVFLECLWLQKDNAASVELGFLNYQFGGREVTHSNFIAVNHSMADGTHATVPFSYEELKQSRARFRAHLGEIVGSDPRQTGHTSKAGRVARALYWTQAARSSGDIGDRLAHFATAMEALVATSNGELAHQLAERMAVLLEHTAEKRQAVYRQVKRLYAFRSRIVHGDVVKASEIESMVLLSKAADEMLRRTLSVALVNSAIAATLAGSKEALDDYFLGRLLSGSNDAGLPSDDVAPAP